MALKLSAQPSQPVPLRSCRLTDRLEFAAYSTQWGMRSGNRWAPSSIPSGQTKAVPGARGYPHGPAVTYNFNGTSDVTEFASVPYIPPPFTCFISILLATTSAETRWISFGGSGAGNGWSIGRASGTGARAIVLTFGNVANYNTTATYQAAARFRVAVAVNGTSARVIVQRESVVPVRQTLTVGTPNSTSNKLKLGAAYNNTSHVDFTPMWFHTGMVWSRALSDEEMLLIMHDPFSVWYRSREGAVNSTGLTILANAIASAEAFGTQQLRLQINPTGLVSTEAFGTANVGLTVVATAIGSAEAFGTQSVLLQISVPVVHAGEVFGTPLMQVDLQIVATAIASSEAFGSATLGLELVCNGIGSAEVVGNPQLLQQIVAAAITSLEAFGTARFDVQVVPVAISSLEAFGLDRVELQIMATPAWSGEVIGAHIVQVAGGGGGGSGIWTRLIVIEVLDE